jgi:hypothetical protein
MDPPAFIDDVPELLRRRSYDSIPPLINQVNNLVGRVRELDLRQEAWSEGDPTTRSAYINALLSRLEENQTFTHVLVGFHFLLNALLSRLEENQTFTHVLVGFHFLLFAREDEQRRLYRALENIQTLGDLSLSGPLGLNSLTTLLESLPRLVRGLRQLEMFHIALSDQSEVELLAAAVGPDGESLEIVLFAELVSSDNENSMGFLDPILNAMSQRHHQPALFSLGGYDRPVNGPSLVTVEALRLFLQSAVYLDESVLSLPFLGLEDDHCKVVAESLVQRDISSDGALGALDLTENPAIGREGYEHILWLLNRAHWLGKVTVDDKSWQAKFNLVAEMNTKHGRGEFLQSGIFDSKIEWVEWLARLAALDESEETDDPKDTLNFLWHTLIEKPEFISH